MTKQDKQCSQCMHFGPWTGACYKRPDVDILVDGARFYRIMECRGDLFVEKKDAPKLKFCQDNLLDR